MSCDEPQQLSLDMPKPQYTAGSPQFQQFCRRLWKLMWENAEDKVLVAELRNYAKFNDFPLVGSFVKQTMRIDLGSEDPNLKGIPPLRILSCFGQAFRGDEVGHIGRDILTPLLGSSKYEVRGAAVDVLEQWLEYDEEGMWLEMVSDHLDRESSPLLQARCESLLEQYDGEAEDMLREMMNDCPECNEGHVLAQGGCWYCDDCGQEWNHDPIEHEYFDDDDLVDDVPDHPKELNPFFEIHREAPNNVRALVETRALPQLLENVLDLHPHLTLDLIESVKIGKLSVRATRLGFYMSQLHNGVDYLLRGWDESRRFCFSIEATATDDRWLVFMRY